MPYISKKKNNQTFNLKSKVDSTFESERYEIIKLHDLNKESIQSLNQYSNIPGTILYNPWSNAFHLYTAGMNLEMEDNFTPIYFITPLSLRRDLGGFVNYIGISTIPYYSFRNLFDTEIGQYFNLKYPSFIGRQWTQLYNRSKGLQGIDYRGDFTYTYYSITPANNGSEYFLDLSLEFIQHCMDLIQPHFRRKHQNSLKTYFMNFCYPLIKKIIINDYMKINRKFSDLISILPESGILSSNSNVLAYGLSYQYLCSSLRSAIENPRFFDQIEIIKKEIFSEFDFKYINSQISSRAFSPSFIDSLDLAINGDLKPDQTLRAWNSWIEDSNWMDKAKNTPISNQVKDCYFTVSTTWNPDPVIVWQPSRFDVINRWGNFKSLRCNFHYRDSRADLPYLYLNSSVHEASKGSSCSVLMVPRNPGDKITLDEVSYFYT